ncbi:MAG: hypothetical protein ACSHX8_05675 [Opitutaceae bacterium]
MRTMPIPDRVRTTDYGREYVGAAHTVHLFPAVIRKQATVEAEAIMEGGQSTCFFHAKLPATAICDVSGRMICDLCKTDYNGKTVSFEALQSLIGKGGSVEKEQSRTKWDDIACSLVILPIVFGPAVALTAPIALGICLFQWRKGPTSLVRRSRWRYVLAAVLAILELCIGGLFLYVMAGGEMF